MHNDVLVAYVKNVTKVPYVPNVMMTFELNVDFWPLRLTYIQLFSR